jgi:hypothetical protein
MRRSLGGVALKTFLSWTVGDALGQHPHSGGAEAAHPKLKARSAEEPAARPALPLCPELRGVLSTPTTLPTRHPDRRPHRPPTIRRLGSARYH